ncbi:MAG: hypothetical protein LBG57_11350, partial [Treponema sp.]|nr:hypothetical protein [Treponema sp.]
KAGSLKYNNVLIEGDSFTLPSAHVTVTAEFEEVPAGIYTVSVAAPSNGGITATPQFGPQGTQITLTVTPASGYGLKAGSLKYNDGSADVPIEGYSFILPAANVTVTAEFETKTASQLVDAGTEYLINGSFGAAITAFESAYQQNPNDTAAVVYSSLGALASIASDRNVRNLVRDRLGFTGYPGTIDSLITGGWMATYADEYRVDYYYENGKGYEWYDPQNEYYAAVLKRYGLPLKAGYYYRESLAEPQFVLVTAERKNGPLDSYYDEELNVYASWYDDSNSVYINGYRGQGYYYYSFDDYTYVFVSDIQKTGPLDHYYDEDLQVWVNWSYSDPGYGNGYQGQGYYWTKMEVLYLGSETPRYETWTERMPGLSAPSWFTETGAYQDSLTSAGALQASRWPLLLFANLVDKNQDGLNDLLGDILSSVFGDAFENAAARFKDLPYDQSVEVDEKLLEALGLTDVLEGDKIYVGKAELSLLFSAVRLFKASLEWVAAYDWNTDISFLKTDWNTLDSISALSPKNLPFGNDFLKDRNNGMMVESRDDFHKALTDSIAAYEHLIGEASKLPPAYIEEMKEFLWLKDGLSKLDAAIQNGGNFYVPENEPSGNTYDNSPGSARIGINMGKLFNPGQFAIDQLITTEPGGKAPQFYAFDNGEPQAITGKAEMDDALDRGSYIGVRIKLDRIRETIVKGMNKIFADHETTIDMPLFPAQIGKELYDLYHK